MLNIGGIYTDPFHSPTKVSANIFGFDAPWYGGIRLCGRVTKDSKQFVTIGCDDGVHFWVLTGEFTDPTNSNGAVDMDFTPKAPGVGRLKCSYVPGALSFLGDDGKVENTWSRLIPTDDFELLLQTKHAAFNDVNGLYVDPAMYKPGSSSFAGIRVVSDRLGKMVTDELCVVGTDDGEEWWALQGGAFTMKKLGNFTVGSLTGECHNGTIKFDDGKAWTKMAIKTDFHTLPKEMDSKK
jgi:hypothetical protein